MRHGTALFLTIWLACFAIAGSPADAVAAAATDVVRVPAAQRSFTRYLYLGHLEGGKARQEMWQIVSAHLNGTSRFPVIVRPEVIVTDGKGVLTERDGLFMKQEEWDSALLVRLNFALYKHKRETWELLAQVDPHFHFREPDLTGKLTKVETKEVLPVVQETPAPIVDFAEIYVDDGRGGIKQTSRQFVRAGQKVYVRKKMGEPLYAFDSLPPFPEQSKTTPVREVVKQEEKKIERKQPVFAAVLPQKEVVFLAKETNSESPVLYADFFWWQTAIQAEREPGPGYYDLLGVKDEGDFHNLVAFDKKLFADKFKDFLLESRAAVGRSGVSKQPRRIAVFDKPGGELWITFDNRKAVGNRNPLDTPDDAFKFDATEQLGHLANGWLAQGLFDGEGKRQDTAPDFAVGPDRTSTSNDGRIHVGLCNRCHDDGGLKSFKDWYRNLFQPPVAISSPDFAKQLEFQQLYFRRIEGKLRPGRERFTEAVREATGLTPQAYSKLISSRWYEYADSGVTLARAARELGTSKERLQAALRGYKRDPLRGLRVYDVWLRNEKEHDPFEIEQWHDVYGEVAIILAGAKP